MKYARLDRISNDEVLDLGKIMKMKKRIQPLKPEAHAPLPREGKGRGKGYKIGFFPFVKVMFGVILVLKIRLSECFD